MPNKSSQTQIEPQAPQVGRPAVLLLYPLDDYVTDLQGGALREGNCMCIRLSSSSAYVAPSVRLVDDRLSTMNNSSLSILDAASVVSQTRMSICSSESTSWEALREHGRAGG